MTADFLFRVIALGVGIRFLLTTLMELALFLCIGTRMMNQECLRLKNQRTPVC